MFTKCKYKSNLLKIAKEINATDVITKIIAFQPPKQCIILQIIKYYKNILGLYSIEPMNVNGCCFKSKQKHCCRYKKVKFIHDLYKNINYKWIEVDCYTYKKSTRKSSSKDKRIVILHLKNKK